MNTCIFFPLNELEGKTQCVHSFSQDNIFKPAYLPCLIIWWITVVKLEDQSWFPSRVPCISQQVLSASSQSHKCALNHKAPEMSLLQSSSPNSNLIKELICQGLICWNYSVLLGHLLKQAEGNHMFSSLLRWDLFIDLIISSHWVLLSNESAEAAAGEESFGNTQ